MEIDEIMFRIQLISEGVKKLSPLSAKILVFACYIFILIISIIIYPRIQSQNSILKLLILDLAATIIIFLISTILDNASLYDPYWSVIPPFFLVFWSLEKDFTFSFFENNGRSILIIIISVFVLFWAIRLTGNWLRGWNGFLHEDWRYIEMRNKSGKWFWLSNLFGIQIFPTLIVFLGGLSIIPLFSINNFTFNFITIFGVLILIISLIVETVSDKQMFIFRKKSENRGKINKTGLWKYSRHPNYLGEIGFWWGLSIVGFSSDYSTWYVFFGPLCISFLFIFVSIPWMDKHQLERKPQYFEYMKKVPPLIPRFLSRNRNS